MVEAVLIAALITVGAGQPIAPAIARAQAGEKVIVRGEHHERLKIDRPVELVGEDATIDGDGQGSVVVVTAPGVVLRNLRVRGSGQSLLHEDAGVCVESAADVTLDRVNVEDTLFGIHVKSSPRAKVTGCRVRGLPIHIAQRGDGIRLYSSPDSRVEDCDVADVRDVIVWFSEGSRFSRNTVRRARYGLHLMNTAFATCEDNVIEDGSVGIFSMYSNAVVLRRNKIGPIRGPSGYGMGLKETDAFTIEDNLIGDVRVGLYFDASPLRADKPGFVRRNHVVWCDTALSFMPSVEGVTVSGNAFIENTSQVEIRGGGKLNGNLWTENGRGNFWSDYDGFDGSGDGTGSTPYRAMNLYEALVDARPDLKLFEGGLAARAIDWGARVVPLIAPEPKVEDEHPLVAAPPVPATAGANVAHGSGTLALLGLALTLAGSGLAFTLGRSS